MRTLAQVRCKVDTAKGRTRMNYPFTVVSPALICAPLADSTPIEGGQLGQQSITVREKKLPVKDTRSHTYNACQAGNFQPASEQGVFLTPNSLLNETKHPFASQSSSPLRFPNASLLAVAKKASEL